MAGRRMRERLALGGVLVLAVGALIPRPLTVTGPFVVAPALSVPLTSPDSGVVAGVYVREGTRVDAGMPLLQVRDLGLEREALAAARRVDSLSAREVQARAAGRPGEMARLEAERATDLARLAGMTAQQRAMTVRALVPGIVVTSRPEQLTGRWVGLGERLIELGQPDSLEIRVALEGAGASQVRPGQPARLVFHADGSTFGARIGAVGQAARTGRIEARIGVRATGRWYPGMTGEASVTLRRSNLWGALWWALRRRVRTDILL